MILTLYLQNTKEEALFGTLLCPNLIETFKKKTIQYSFTQKLKLIKKSLNLILINNDYESLYVSKDCIP